MARQRDLAVVRHAEVLKHAFALGIDAHEVWKLPDGGLDDLPASTLVDSIVEVIRRQRPDLVITFWPGSGISMHPDHMAVGAAVEEAVRRLQGSGIEDGAPRWIAYPLLPQRALRRFGGERGRTVAENQPAPTHTVPIDAGTKRRGWRIHASQRDYTREVYGCRCGSSTRSGTASTTPSSTLAPTEASALFSGLESAPSRPVGSPSLASNVPVIPRHPHELERGW